MESLKYRQDGFTGRFALGEADITPPVDIYARNWGAAAHDRAEGVHRPLMMQALVIGGQQADDLLVLLTADLGWWKNQSDERYIRHALLKDTGLQPHQLLFCLSHTHAGPSICRDDADKPGGAHIAPYLEKIREVAVTLIRTCQQRMQPATLTWGYGTCDLATNRDLLQDGSYWVGFNPGKKADPTVLVGCIRDDSGKVLGTVVNYACHPTTLAHNNRLLSPDYVGAMRELVSTATEAPCLFLQGASGELAPREQYVADTGVADSHGRKLGYAVLAALESLLPNHTRLALTGSLTSGAPLAIWEYEPDKAETALSGRIVNITVDLKELPSLRDIQAEWAHCPDRVLKDRLWRKLNTRRAVGDGQTSTLEVWVWKLGGAYIVAQANEAYSDFQTAIRAAFPGRAIGVVNIANGYVGYLPPADAYDRDQYAVWQTPYERGALEKLIKGTIDALTYEA
jgi:Neutral/alkaline non-lysosomal ceramidase.